MCSSISANIGLASLEDVCDALLSPFPGLEETVRSLAKEHELDTVPKLTAVFAAAGSIPEGVPPSAAVRRAPSAAEREADRIL